MTPSPPVSSPPPQAPSPPPEPADQLENIRARLHQLQADLAQQFSRSGWDEYLRLRRTARAQSA